MSRSLALLAALLLATPALAHRDGDDDEWRGDDELSWDSGDRSDGWSSDSPDSWDSSWDSHGEDAPPTWSAWERESRRGPSFDDFRRDRELSWAGEWIDTPEYGLVWRPTHVSSDWRPYTLGRWAWTPAGWTWVSDEPFGWAVYHYGRWAWLAGRGWTWVPGRVWAPAWVAWRWGNGYAGWCALGPRAVVAYEPARWVFVPERQFLAPVRQHVVPIYQARSFAPRTQTFPLLRGVRAGPPVAYVERRIGLPVRSAPVVEVNHPRAAASSGSNQVFVYRPRTAPISHRGWSGTVGRPSTPVVRPSAPAYRQPPPPAQGGPQQGPHASSGPRARPGN